jgi:hypothetical protein
VAQVRFPESPHAESLDDSPNKRIRVFRRNSLRSGGMDDRVAPCPGNIFGSLIIGLVVLAYRTDRKEFGDRWIRLDRHN